ncbi:MAG: ABC transporter substrate-binding protein [Roseibium sp.]
MQLFDFGFERPASLKGLIVGTVAAIGVAAGSTAALSQDASGEIVMINWLGGAQGEMMTKLQDDFVAKNPKASFRNIVPQAAGDARGGIRQIILGGEQADLLINTWPAFRKELADSGLIIPVDNVWEEQNLGDKLPDAWKNLSVLNGDNYGVTYTFGNRSGIWYQTSTLQNANIEAPTTWEEFVGGFAALQAKDITPMAIPAKVWAHAEWFESILIRTAGVETATKLANHEIPWTDPAVKTALGKWAELIEANCCRDPNTMLATAWDNAVDASLKTGDAAYVLMGMWLNTRAKVEYGKTPGTDYTIFQFPAMGMGHDNTSMVDAKEFNMLATAKNLEGSAAFMAYMLSADAAAIMADYGLASPSSDADTSLYDPVVRKSVEEVAKAEKVQFVLGDLLPGDLGGEYRVQLQKFLTDPSSDNIDQVTAAIEAVAAGAY